MKEMEKDLVQKLETERNLADDELLRLLSCTDPEVLEDLAERARNVRERYYGKDVYIRGLIEFSSYCRNDCLYCGLRRSNKNAQRYRLTLQEILSCQSLQKNRKYDEHERQDYKYRDSLCHIHPPSCLLINCSSGLLRCKHQMPKYLAALL